MLIEGWLCLNYVLENDKIVEIKLKDRLNVFPALGGLQIYNEQITDLLEPS